MSFGFDAIFWGLPLIFLPVLIHLFNRLRHRKLPWAAMMFLRMANRKSTRYAKLRQWLVLLFRVLALLMLLFALGQPMAGGWASSFFSGKPDVVVIVLDRSTSMEGRPGEASRLELARTNIIKEIKSLGEGVQVMLVDPTTDHLQAVTNSAALVNLMSGGVNDVAADVPAQMESVLEWFQAKNRGRGEVWIGSDLQASNWGTTHERWQRMSEAFEKLPQKVRVRVLAVNDPLKHNRSVRVNEVLILGSGNLAELQLEVEVQREDDLKGNMTATVYLGIENRTLDVEMTINGARHTQFVKLPLADASQAGWGWVELPDDDNTRDNRAYFVYGNPGLMSTAVVGGEDYPGRFLRMAAAPNLANTNQVAVLLDDGQQDASQWAKHAMVLWQGALPEGQVAKDLLKYTESGGVLVCFPGDTDSEAKLAGLRWGPRQDFRNEQGRPYPSWREIEAAQGEKQDHLGPRIQTWEESEGPLARTEEGFSLPLDGLYFARWRTVEGDGTVLAALSRDSDPGTSSEPFLVRKVYGKGQIIFCGSSPADGWSSLNYSIVLPIMLQRLLAEGAVSGSGRFSLDRMRTAGVGGWPPGVWEPLGVKKNETRNFNTEAGVYHQGSQMVAVNRARTEDDAGVLRAQDATAKFGDMPVTLFEVKRKGNPGDRERIWKWFLSLMAAVLLVEGFLILPKGADERVVIDRSSTGKVSPETSA